MLLVSKEKLLKLTIRKLFAMTINFSDKEYNIYFGL